MTDAAIPGRRLGSVSEWCAWLFGPLADRLVAEGDRRLLWLPVFFGAGIGAYFTLTFEPPLWPSIAAAIAGPSLGVCVTPAPGVVRSGACVHRLGRRLCADAGDRPGARGADAAAS